MATNVSVINFFKETHEAEDRIVGGLLAYKKVVEKKGNEGAHLTKLGLDLCNRKIGCMDISDANGNAYVRLNPCVIIMARPPVEWRVDRIRTKFFTYIDVYLVYDPKKEEFELAKAAAEDIIKMIKKLGYKVFEPKKG
ncbi:hypothetical protein ACFLQI_01140 [Candidatus Undinarchaeota archaeon]